MSPRSQSNNAGKSIRIHGDFVMLAKLQSTSVKALGTTVLISAIALFTFSTPAIAAEPGLITKQSRYSVRETIDRFEAAVNAKEANGFMLFTEIDHAAAAKKFGLNMLPRTVIVFGNPKNGTPVMQKTPTLAIDVPPRALVWQDDEGKVWLTYNSSAYLGNTIYPRHGIERLRRLGSRLNRLWPKSVTTQRSNTTSPVTAATNNDPQFWPRGREPLPRRPR